MTRESLAEFARRHLPANPPKPPSREPAPGRVRRRARGRPPDFGRRVRQARDYVRRHRRLEAPELRDVKRLSGGQAALLFRGRRGMEAAVVTEPTGAVCRTLSPGAFRATDEAL